MLSDQSECVTVENNNKEVIITQRRIIVLLLILLLTMVFLLTAKVLSDKEKERQAQDIISTAQKKADELIANATNDSTKIVYVSTLYANQKAESITNKANADAETITKNAQDKANKIINDAINTKIDDVQTLLAITEAEAGGEPVKGRAAVAATIKNRLVSKEFKSDSIKGVVYAPGQFDAVSNGNIRRVQVTAPTIEGVKLCLQGKDYSNGALYFYNPRISSPASVRWFSTMETTTIIGGHVFKK